MNWWQWCKFWMSVLTGAAGLVLIIAVMESWVAIFHRVLSA